MNYTDEITNLKKTIFLNGPVSCDEIKFCICMPLFDRPTVLTLSEGKIYQHLDDESKNIIRCVLRFETSLSKDGERLEIHCDDCLMKNTSLLDRPYVYIETCPCSTDLKSEVNKCDVCLIKYSHSEFSDGDLPIYETWNHSKVCGNCIPSNCINIENMSVRNEST